MPMLPNIGTKHHQSSPILFMTPIISRYYYNGTQNVHKSADNKLVVRVEEGGREGGH